MAPGRIEDLLWTAAERWPDAPAYSLAKRSDVVSITYGALALEARKLATWLGAQGVMDGQRVGICVPKTPHMLVAVYGILMAGGCYVPLDKAAPADRNRAIGESCGLTLTIDADFDWSAVEGTAPIARPERRDPQAPAYILHTSGTTGQPKGVVLTHRNALAFVESVLEAFDFGPNEVFAHHAPLHFDLSVFDLFVAAALGGSVEAVPPMLGMFPPKLAQFIAQRGITVWNSVASLLTMLDAKGDLARAGITDLRQVFFSGDVLAPTTLKSLSAQLPRTRFHNIYGQTEANSSLCAVFTPERINTLSPDRPLSIGRALPGFDLLLVDDDGAPIEEPDVRGELWVGGETVSPGYWQSPQQTTARFGPPPHDASSRRYYRTGDLAFRDADGNYFFAGRSDHQIKTRGYRVELGEVERALLTAPGVGDASVVAIDDPTFGKRIVAAFVPHDTEVDAKAVLAYLSKRLPAYMLPDPLQAMKSLPRTSTGKADHRALQAHFQDR